MKLQSKVKEDIKLSPNAMYLLKRRYLLKDNNKNIIETPSELFRRVAYNVSQAERNFKASEIEEKFYQMMRNLEFLPNSPTLMNAGTLLGQLSACHVLPVEDSIEDIFESLKTMARIHKSGGGTGFSFSHLRPKGDLISSTKGEASGPVSFMNIYNQATGVIVQGGRRRGANMGILRCDHPDIMEFIEAKKKEGSFVNFNLSVGATDKFMKAVRLNKNFNLVNPRTKKTVRKVKARAIFDVITKAAWHSGDPGLVFLDEINRKNPIPAIGQIEATNPCLTAENWIMTSEGPRKLRELIDKSFSILINGESYPAHKNGFFSAGIKPVFKLITKEDYDLEATENHLILKVEEITRYKIKTAWAELKDLKRGDKILINNHRNFKGWPGKHDEKEGYLVGLLVGDGVLNAERAMLYSWIKVKGQETIRELAYTYLNSFPHRKDFKGWVGNNPRGVVRLSTAYLKELALKLGMRPQQKKITEKIEICSSKFYQGFLRGLFDSDGTVIGNQLKGVSIRLAQSNLKTLQTVQRMLLRLGIISVIYKNRRPQQIRSMPDGKGGFKDYLCKAQHELVISNENIFHFAEKIGFIDSKKANKLKEILKRYKRRLNKERFIATIERIVPTGRKHTFDLQVPGINKFDANGFIVHNCGEQPLLPYESCNLASINLAKMIKTNSVDWQKLKEYVGLGIRFLDDVIEVNKFPLSQIKKVTSSNRKIGLGIMGFADMLISLGIPYTSKKAVEIAKAIMSFIHKESLNASHRLAKERGVFKNYKHSIYAKKNFKMRNATINTIAPTGSISIIAGCSSGIEPIFAVTFLRNVLSGTRMFEINPLFEKSIKEKGLFNKGLITKVARSGSIQDVKEIPPDMRRVFITAFDVPPRQHLLVQATFQKYTDNSVSKTVNLAKDATIEDVKNIYLLAHKLRCKGITVYRYGSRRKQVLSFESEYLGSCGTEACYV